MPAETPTPNLEQKNRIVAIYLAVVGVTGGALIVLAALGTLGGWGYGAGGLLLFAGAGGLVGMKKQGGFGSAPCPSCGANLQFQFTRQARIMCCEKCGAWS
jgi:hypothetical protein